MLVAICWLAAGALYLTLPPAPDQFHHAYLGWRWVEGDIPYRDFIDMNWPGIPALNAVATWIFGVHLWTWRAADFALFAVSAAFLSDLVRRASGRDAGILGLALSPLIYAGMDAWIAGQHDMSAAQFLVAALWFHVVAYQRQACAWQLGAGFFVAAAMLCKPTVGVIALLFPLQALLLRTSARIVLAHTAVLSISIVSTLLVAMGAIIALGTPLPDLVDAIYTYNAATQFASDAAGTKTGGVTVAHPAQAPIARMLDSIAHEKARWWLVMTILSLPALVSWLRPGSRSIASSALPMLGLTGMLSFLIQAKGFGYHLSPVAPALIGSLAASIALIATRISRPGAAPGRKVAGKTYLVIAALWIASRLVSAFYTLPMALATGDFGRHLSRFNAGDELVVQDVVEFARRVDAFPQSDCVLALGTVSSINYLSHRRQPTRFYYFPVLAKARPPLPMAEHWVDLWESDLKGANCQFVVIAKGIKSDWLPGPSRAAGALRAFLDDYRETGALGSTGGMVIYERK